MLYSYLNSSSTRYIYIYLCNPRFKSNVSFEPPSWRFLRANGGGRFRLRSSAVAAVAGAGGGDADVVVVLLLPAVETASIDIA